MLEALGWIAIGVAWPMLGFLTAVAIGRVCRVDVEAPRQRARRLMRRGARLDVAEAVRGGRGR